jgi:hypothetical protein
MTGAEEIEISWPKILFLWGQPLKGSEKILMLNFFWAVRSMKLCLQKLHLLNLHTAGNKTSITLFEMGGGGGGSPQKFWFIFY